MHLDPGADQIYHVNHIAYIHEAISFPNNKLYLVISRLDASATNLATYNIQHMPLVRLYLSGKILGLIDAAVAGIPVPVPELLSCNM